MKLEFRTSLQSRVVSAASCERVPNNHKQSEILQNLLAFSNEFSDVLHLTDRKEAKFLDEFAVTLNQPKYRPISSFHEFPSLRAGL